MSEEKLHINPMEVSMIKSIPSNLEEMQAVKEAKLAIENSRAMALQTLFAGKKIIPRISQFKGEAKKAKDAAEKAKAKLSKLGLDIPDLQTNLPNYNFLVGLHFKKLTVPRLNLPGIDIPIPNITLGELPGFNLGIIGLLRGRLPKWRHRFIDFLPNVNLGALMAALLDKVPNLEFYYLTLQIENIFDIKLSGIGLPNDWFKLPTIGTINIPNIDFNFQGISIDNPIDIDLSSIQIPGFDMPRLFKIPGFDRVLRLLIECFDTVDFDLLSDIFGELFTEMITDFFTSAIPVLGAIKSGGQAAIHWGKCANKAHKAHKVKTQKLYLLPGDAQAAADAVKKLLKERAAHHAVIGSIKTAQFGGQVAGLFGDCGAASGPIIAAASSVAVICEKITFMGMEFKRVKVGNKLLKSSQLNKHLFQVTPILGCYFLVCTTTSDILGVLVDDITDDPNWMLKWEQNKKKYIDPLQNQARIFITESKFKITPDPPKYAEPPGKLKKMKKGFLSKFKKK